MRKKKGFKRILLLLMCIMILGMFPISSSAASFPENGSMTILFNDSGTALSGANVKVYKVADMNNAGVFTLTESFAASKLPLNDYSSASDFRTASTTLEGYAALATPSATGTVDGTGRVSFSLPVGLYLVSADLLNVGSTTYTFSPSLISIPDYDEKENVWNPEVTVTSKFSKVSGHDTPDPTYRKYKLVKHWSGDEGEESDRPSSVTVNIIKNSKVVETVELSDANNWTHEWSVIFSDKNTWNVVETNVPEGYVATVSTGMESLNKIFTITNTKTTEIIDNPPGLIDTPTLPGITIPDNQPPQASTPPGETVTPPGETVDIPDETVPLAPLPQTGQLWWPIPVLVIMGLLLFAFGWILTQKDKLKHEKA